MIYILDISPFKYMNKITLEESWLSRKPYVSDFLIFGFIAYAHIPKEWRIDLDLKIKLYMVIGHNE